MFEKILIANRGEIALRVLRACKELGISDRRGAFDRRRRRHACAARRRERLHRPAAGARTATSMFRRCSPPARSPAPTPCIPATAFSRRTPALPKSSAEHNVHFIGPRPEHIRLMGDKIAAKRAAEGARHSGRARLASGVSSRRRGAGRWRARSASRVLLKAAAGGGGRGMKVAASRARRARGLRHRARRGASAAFGDDTVYLEKYLEQPRHIEVQVLGDGNGARHAILASATARCSAATRRCWRKPPPRPSTPAARDADRRDRRRGDARHRLSRRRHRRVPLRGRRVLSSSR